MLSELYFKCRAIHLPFRGKVHSSAQSKLHEAVSGAPFQRDFGLLGASSEHLVRRSTVSRLDQSTRGDADAPIWKQCCGIIARVNQTQFWRPHDGAQNSTSAAITCQR